MVVQVPVVSPVTVPLSEPTVALAGLLLLQVPPGGVPESVIEALTQTAVPPVMVGIGFTVTVALPVMVLLQPVTELVATTV